MTDVRQRSILPLAAALLTHCVLGCAPGACEEETTLKVFAEKSFYLERTEPEETLVGTFLASVVREGPNTRDMPFKLVTDEQELSVYSSGFDEKALQRYAGREVEVVGKRIDQREEGHGIEIWIATITRRREKPSG